MTVEPRYSYSPSNHTRFVVLAECKMYATRMIVIIIVLSICRNRLWYKFLGYTTMTWFTFSEVITKLLITLSLAQWWVASTNTLMIKSTLYVVCCILVTLIYRYMSRTVSQSTMHQRVIINSEIEYYSLCSSRVLASSMMKWDSIMFTETTPGHFDSLVDTVEWLR